MNRLLAAGLLLVAVGCVVTPYWRAEMTIDGPYVGVGVEGTFTQPFTFGEGETTTTTVPE